MIELERRPPSAATRRLTVPTAVTRPVNIRRDPPRAGCRRRARGAPRRVHAAPPQWPAPPRAGPPRPARRPRRARPGSGPSSRRSTSPSPSSAPASCPPPSTSDDSARPVARAPPAPLAQAAASERAATPDRLDRFRALARAQRARHHARSARSRGGARAPRAWSGSIARLVEHDPQRRRAAARRCRAPSATDRPPGRSRRPTADRVAPRRAATARSRAPARPEIQRERPVLVGDAPVERGGELERHERAAPASRYPPRNAAFCAAASARQQSALDRDARRAQRLRAAHAPRDWDPRARTPPARCRRRGSPRCRAAACPGGGTARASRPASPRAPAAPAASSATRSACGPPNSACQPSPTDGASGVEHHRADQRVGCHAPPAAPGELDRALHRLVGHVRRPTAQPVNRTPCDPALDPSDHPRLDARRPRPPPAQPPRASAGRTAIRPTPRLNTSRISSVGHLAGLLQEPEERRPLPRAGSTTALHPFGQHPHQVAGDAAAGDVGQRVQPREDGRHRRARSSGAPRGARRPRSSRVPGQQVADAKPEILRARSCGARV